MSNSVSNKHIGNNGPNNHFRLRLFKDKLATHVVGVGGLSVIFFITLIFFYLLYVVFPLFLPASVERVSQFKLSGVTGHTKEIVIDERGDMAARIADQGSIAFFNAQNGSVIKELSIAGAETITSYARSNPFEGIHGYGTDKGNILFFKPSFDVSYRDTERVVTPSIAYPLGEAPIAVDPQAMALRKIAFQNNEEGTTIAAITEDGRFVLTHLAKTVSMLDDSVTWESQTVAVPAVAHPVDFLLMDKRQFHLFAVSQNGEVTSIDIEDKNNPTFVEHRRIVDNDQQLTSIRFLTGDISLLVGDSQGQITQWSLLRGNDNIYRLTQIRQFEQGDRKITAISPELARKGFVASDDQGNFGIFHTTAHRELVLQASGHTTITYAALAPRANKMLLEDDQQQLSFWNIENDHPEVSWSSLWGKVWYENYPEPDYVWQSSSASDDFEPKYSLVPITFGTLKAAFYALLIGIPIALCGALYTAQFMSQRMRSVVKPSIEIMEALPTVILGFLAGLWLAPFVEKHLPGVFSILIVLPLGIVATALLWEKVPAALKMRVADGWEAAILLPIVAFIIWVALFLSPTMESLFFGGDMRHWLTNEMGVGFDQRNAIVVGIAMGFAVIPLIFSIAEDAVFGVPKHLIQGSLALGATPWQTMIRVVLLTASPGIFSAIMIGLGRAVGETMIVLMATGNTPVMNFSIFQGLRTLSANIAVELPESAVNSTHFRVLFLAGLVLFLFTFVVNTIAELVRQNLRKKYSSL